jgi:hypothetical protein
VFTARYALSPYIKQIRFVFKGLRMIIIWVYTPCSVICSCWRFGRTCWFSIHVNELKLRLRWTLYVPPKHKRRYKNQEEIYSNNCHETVTNHEPSRYWKQTSSLQNICFTRSVQEVQPLRMLQPLQPPLITYRQSKSFHHQPVMKPPTTYHPSTTRHRQNTKYQPATPPPIINHLYLDRNWRTGKI